MFTICFGFSWIGLNCYLWRNCGNLAEWRGYSYYILLSEKNVIFFYLIFFILNIAFKILLKANYGERDSKLIFIYLAFLLSSFLLSNLSYFMWNSFTLYRINHLNQIKFNSKIKSNYAQCTLVNFYI